MPRTILGFVLSFTGLHQAGLALLSVAVFGLSAVPLELQRRIINGLTSKTGVETILGLALAYAGVALAEQLLKLTLNVYRGWVAESTVRRLRERICGIAPGPHAASSEGTGVEIAMILEEAEPIGGFTGVSVSEPLLQGGILVSVIGYMTFLEPWTLVLCAAFLLPQLLFVPLMQQAINRRAGERITTLRKVSGDIVDSGVPADAGIERVFALNMGIYKIKYSMNMAMNLMYALAVAVALGVGGWLAVAGRIEVGTVVAVVSGLGKLNDPWGDLVNWAREWSVDSVKYRLFADAVNGKGLATA